VEVTAWQQAGGGGSAAGGAEGTNGGEEAVQSGRGRGQGAATAESAGDVRERRVRRALNLEAATLSCCLAPLTLLVRATVRADESATRGALQAEKRRAKQQ
jgi:hypothetical protein